MCQNIQDNQNTFKRHLTEALEILPDSPESFEPIFAKQFIKKYLPTIDFNVLQQLYDYKHNRAQRLKLSTQSVKSMFLNIVYMKFKDLQKYKQQGSVKNYIKCNIRNKQGKLVEIQNQQGDTPNLVNENLQFDSKFESANLALVGKISDNQYNLLLDNDINTVGFTQWFLFKVKIHTKSTVKFNILNFRKDKSLYQKGMKICIFSENQQINRCSGWIRGGFQISYFQNYLEFNDNREYYTLSWKYRFEYEEDEVYFSLFYPYTYSMLKQLYFQTEIYNNTILKRKLLCKTVSGNSVYYLTITESSKIQKKVVFLMARTHPGESIGSFIIEDIIRYLLSNQKEAVQLRSKLIFKIIPMMNPDGVIHGNSRCSLTGRDLNRIWNKTQKKRQPEIYSLKKLIQAIHTKKKNIHLICDFHGHSIKKDTFVYGCHDQLHPFSTRQFPWFFSKFYKNFNYNTSAFSNSKDKQGTARLTLFKMLKIPNIFTLETSLCGPQKSAYHWTRQQLKNLAKGFCEALNLHYIRPQQLEMMNGNRKQVVNINQDQLKIRQKYLSQLYQHQQNYEININDEQSGTEIQMDYLDFNLSDKNMKFKSMQAKKSEQTSIYPQITALNSSKEISKNHHQKKIKELHNLVTEQKIQHNKQDLFYQIQDKYQIDRRYKQFDSIKFWKNTEKKQNYNIHLIIKARKVYTNSQVYEDQIQENRKIEQKRRAILSRYKSRKQKLQGYLIQTPKYTRRFHESITKHSEPIEFICSPSASYESPQKSLRSQYYEQKNYTIKKKKHSTIKT